MEHIRRIVAVRALASSLRPARFVLAARDRFFAPPPFAEAAAVPVGVAVRSEARAICLAAEPEPALETGEPRAPALKQIVSNVSDERDAGHKRRYAGPICRTAAIYLKFFPAFTLIGSATMTRGCMFLRSSSILVPSACCASTFFRSSGRSSVSAMIGSTCAIRLSNLSISKPI